MGLNQKQKSILNDALDDIIRRIKINFMTYALQGMFLTSIRWILKPRLSLSEQATLESWNVWNDVSELRYVYMHPVPQNQERSDPELEVPYGKVGYRGNKGNVVYELRGLFSLTRWNEDHDKVTKEDVVDCLNSKLTNLIASLEFEGIKDIVLDKKIDVGREVVPELLFNERTLGADCLEPFEQAITAAAFIEISKEVRKVIVNHAKATRLLLEEGRSLAELIEAIKNRILRNGNILDFANKNPGVYAQLIEMSDEAYRSVECLFLNSSINAFLKRHGYVFLKLKGSSHLRWNRFGELLITPFASLFMVEHMYLIELMLSGTDQQFQAFLEVFSRKACFDYLYALCKKPIFYQKIKEAGEIGKVLLVLLDNSVRDFVMANEWIWDALFSLSEAQAQNAVILFRRRDVQDYVSHNSERLKIDFDLVDIKDPIARAYEYDEKEEGFEMVSFP